MKEKQRKGLAAAKAAGEEMKSPAKELDVNRQTLYSAPAAVAD